MIRRITFSSILILLITALGFFLRFYSVSTIPPSLSWDEVSIGYNAYSILKTGKDEHGKFLPIDTFVAYGDYKPPLSIYITVPFIAMFGLNEYSVRIPVVLLSSIAIPLLYIMTSELFKKYSNNGKFSNEKKSIVNNKNSSLFLKKESIWHLNQKNWEFSTYIGILSALLLAISPWHIQLSRAGFEATMAFTFLLLGISLLLLARRNQWLLFISFLPFIAAIYTFNSARYAGPLIAISIILFSWKDIRAFKKELCIGLIIAFITFLPILPHLLSPQSRLRLNEVSIFNTQTVTIESNKRITVDGNTWWSKILHNRRIGYAKLYLEHFLDNVRPDFLFTRGDGNPKFSTQETGQLYLIEAPLLLIGIVVMIFNFPSIALLLLFYGMFANAPAGFAVETPHALRTLNALPIFLIPISLGIIVVLKKVYSMFIYRNLTFVSYVFFILFISMYLFSLLHFCHQYFVHLSTEYSGEWQYGYKQAITYAKEHTHEYDSIVITESIGRPWMYIAFYTKYEPNQYRKDIVGIFDAAGFYNVSKLGKWRISREGKLAPEGRTLYILDPKDVPNGANVKDTITLLNGDTKLVIFE
jgi:hypothetical protein